MRLPRVRFMVQRMMVAVVIVAVALAAVEWVRLNRLRDLYRQTAHAFSARTRLAEGRQSWFLWEAAAERG